MSDKLLFLKKLFKFDIYIHSAVNIQFNGELARKMFLFLFWILRLLFCLKYNKVKSQLLKCMCTFVDHVTVFLENESIWKENQLPTAVRGIH